MKVPGSIFQVSVKKIVKRAFTLIEIMVVVAVMGVILAAGVPTLYRALHKEGFRKAISDVIDVCSDARSRAILNEATTEVIFQPREGTCSSGGKSAHFTENAMIEMLDVNLREYKEMDSVRVRFFPNGTSDEMTLILHSDKNEWKKISLEITTGLATVSNSLQ
jgi:prepilin-type N-terminal cleavage/methylation domain-containing protein